MHPSFPLGKIRFCLHRYVPGWAGRVLLGRWSQVHMETANERAR